MVFVVSICAPAAFAQMARGLRYVPQAVKGAKAVPYVVNPKLSPALRPNLTVPVVRPNVAAQVAPAVERAVAAKVDHMRRRIVDRIVAENLVAPERIIERRAIRAATLATQQVREPKQITEHYIKQLVWFYKKLDPDEVGNVGKPYERNLNKLLEKMEHFIAENDRFPSRYAEDEFESWLRKSFDYACSHLYYPLSDTESQLLSMKEKWVKPRK